MKRIFQKFSAILAENDAADLAARGIFVAGALALATVVLLGGCAMSSYEVVQPPAKKTIDGPGLAAADALCDRATSSVPRAYKRGGKTTPYSASTSTFGTEENITTLYTQKCGAEAKGGEYVPPAGAPVGP